MSTPTKPVYTFDPNSGGLLKDGVLVPVGSLPIEDMRWLIQILKSHVIQPK